MIRIVAPSHLRVENPQLIDSIYYSFLDWPTHRGLQSNANSKIVASANKQGCKIEMYIVPISHIHTLLGHISEFLGTPSTHMFPSCVLRVLGEGGTQGPPLFHFHTQWSIKAFFYLKRASHPLLAYPNIELEVWGLPCPCMCTFTMHMRNACMPPQINEVGIWGYDECVMHVSLYPLLCNMKNRFAHYYWHGEREGERERVLSRLTTYQ